MLRCRISVSSKLSLPVRVKKTFSNVHTIILLYNNCIKLVVDFKIDNSVLFCNRKRKYLRKTEAVAPVSSV